MPRLVCPSWRWMTISGTPSRAISTAWAWRSWCGAKRRRTSGCRGGLTELRARGGRRPGAPAGRPAQDAQQRPDGQRDADVEPWLKLFPGPVIHSDLAAATALAAAHEQRAAARVEVGLA